MRTLVLNKNWLPVSHVTWKRAFILICKEVAEIIESYDIMIKTPRDFYYMPAVIRLLTFDNVPKTKVAYSKRSVLERDKFKCQYCATHLVLSNATIDHVIPRSRGGKSSFENTVACCERCNKRKADRLPEEARMNLLHTPKRPKISEYELYLPRIINRIWASYIPKGMLTDVQITN